MISAMSGVLDTVESGVGVGRVLVFKQSSFSAVFEEADHHTPTF